MLTRAEILESYKVDSNGIIRSPGKFESEMLYAPSFWECGLDGCLEEIGDEDQPCWAYDLQQEDLDEYPELSDQGFTVGDRLYIEETESGFVSCYGTPRKAE